MDTIKLTGDNLRSVQREPDEEEEMLFAELYKELEEVDRRTTRTRRGRGRGVRVGGRSRGVTIRRASTPTPSGEDSSSLPSLPRVFVRRGSASSRPIEHDDIPSPPREPEFDDEGNLLSEGERADDPYSPEESSSENSLDEHSDSDGGDSDDSDSPF